MSCKTLLDWIEDHPNKSEPEAPLWCALDNNHLGNRLCYKNFRAIIKRIAKKAYIKRDIWPYLYRHTSLTSMAKVFTESRLEQFAGWTHGSKMTSRYVHFSARDLEDAILELHGLKTTTKDTGITKIVNCPRCGNKNPIGKIRCATCSMIIDKETALNLENVEMQKANGLEKDNVELQTRLNKLEEAISALIDSRGKV